MVTCNQTSMKVEVEKSFPIQLHEDNLHLNQVRDSTCNLSTLSNATHLVAVIPLNACGSIVEVRLSIASNCCWSSEPGPCRSQSLKFSGF